jgi:hypothetical protein
MLPGFYFQAVETAWEVGTLLGEWAQELGFNEVTSHCEAFFFGKQRKMSTLMDFSDKRDASSYVSTSISNHQRVESSSSISDPSQQV